MLCFKTFALRTRVRMTKVWVYLRGEGGLYQARLSHPFSALLLPRVGVQEGKILVDPNPSNYAYLTTHAIGRGRLRSLSPLTIIFINVPIS